MRKAATGVRHVKPSTIPVGGVIEPLALLPKSRQSATH
jgi:hypothetical protein